MLRNSALATTTLLAAGLLLQGCIQEKSTTTPNISAYGSQVRGGPWLELVSRGKNNQKPPAGTILIWTPDYEGMNPMVQTRIDQTLKNLIQRFQERYNMVNVIWRKYSDSNIYKKYSEKVKEGLGPDLLLAHNFMIPALRKKNEIEAIPANSVRFGELRPKLLKTAGANGTLYAIPFIINLQLLCINKQKARSTPKTFNELLELSRSGISIAIGGNFLETIWGLPGFNAKLFGANKSSAQDLKEGLNNWIKTLRKSDEEPNVALFKNSSLMTKYFAEGKISIINCESIDLPFLRNKLGSENLGISELPSINGKNSEPRLTGASFVLNPFASKSQTKLALRFSNYAISVDQQQQIAINWNSLLPVNKNSDFNQELLPVRTISEKAFAKSSELTDRELETMILNYNAIQEIYQDATAGLIDPVKASNEIIELFESPQ
ncbi:bacterial extracellular solute-binding family protein [Synechococcus sp. BIOS-E4-1]|uniref:extracellular solute-binding protein n=1 Tax=Synechococcus sp. BIOS-E4-1 TaxID=1400864 RepID=UPI00164677E9|nr:extracellular solute-binding protein [Synechococcus sp. BIOS-E4-1]QNI55561.1 bacterial extracellular solute-binding family protein [Synechococcus sp. BIOS-E4-1]